MLRIFNQYISLKSVLLMGIESVLIVLSLLAGSKLRFWNSPIDFFTYIDSAGFIVQAITVLIVLEICCYYNKLYDLNTVQIRGNSFIQLTQALGTGCILLGVLYYFAPSLLVGQGVLVIAVLLIVGTVTATRAGVNQVWRLTTRDKNVLILGTGEMAMSVAREFERRADLSFRVVGFVASEKPAWGDLLNLPVFGDYGELEAAVIGQRVSRIVVALEDQRSALPTRRLVQLRVRGIEVEDAHSALAALTGRVWLRAVRPSWFVFSGGFRRSRATLLFKRGLDLVFGLLGLVVISPLIALIPIAIWLDSKGPALYFQERVGLGGTVFNIIKFRSMRIGAEVANGAQWAQKHDLRVTRVGRFLRKYRLDELPQIVNVIRGEMSFVGPRPERPCFVEQLRKAIPFYDERHTVRPGVTGWAQVEYTYGASAQDSFRKLEYDLFYLKNMSIFFDLAITLKTVRVVLFAEGGW